MRKRYAAQIRTGLLTARMEVRARREKDLKMIIESMWVSNELEGLSRRAYTIALRKERKRLK